VESPIGTALSSIFIGDLVTPHAPGEPFEYVSSVLLLEGELRQVSLPEALGEYPPNPAKARLSDQQLAEVEKAATPTKPVASLLALADDDTFMMCDGFGAAILRNYVAEREPGLLGDPALEIVQPAAGRSAFGGTFWLVVLVLAFVAVLLALGATIAVRVVSGF
jgi:hypothetical protein